MAQLRTVQMETMEEKTIITLVVLVFIGLLVFVGYVEIERQKWLDEHCQVIGEVSSSVGTAVTYTGGKNGGVGVGPVFIPGKTGYQCDDGKQYWE